MIEAPKQLFNNQWQCSIKTKLRYNSTFQYLNVDKIIWFSIKFCFTYLYLIKFKWFIHSLRGKIPLLNIPRKLSFIFRQRDLPWYVVTVSSDHLSISSQTPLLWYQYFRSSHGNLREPALFKGMKSVQYECSSIWRAIRKSFKLTLH